MNENVEFLRKGGSHWSFNIKPPEKRIGKVKLYLGKCHYATILLDDIKDMQQNCDYWFIEMKDGDIWEDCQCAVITYDPNEPVGYFIKEP